MHFPARYREPTQPRANALETGPGGARRNHKTRRHGRTGRPAKKPMRCPPPDTYYVRTGAFQYCFSRRAYRTSRFSLPAESRTALMHRWVSALALLTRCCALWSRVCSSVTASCMACCSWPCVPQRSRSNCSPRPPRPNAPRNRTSALETAEGLSQTGRVHSRGVLKHLAERILYDFVRVAVFADPKFPHGQILVRGKLAQSLGDDLGETRWADAARNVAARLPPPLSPSALQR